MTDNPIEAKAIFYASPPCQEVSSDFYGPLSDGCYLFVNHCDYSRWIDVKVIKSVSAEKVIPVVKELFTLLGTPLVYRTDNGAPFNSFVFNEFARQWGFKHRKVTPYWPRANGEAESVMKKLGSKCYVQRKSRA